MIEIIDQNPFMLSVSKHAPIFFNSLSMFNANGTASL